MLVSPGFQKFALETNFSQVGNDRGEETAVDEDEDLPPPLSLFDAITEETYGVVEQTKLNSGDKTSKDEDGPSLMEQMIAEATKARKEKEKIETQKKRESTTKASFGFKKGFLTASSKQTNPSNSGIRVTSKKNSKPPKKVMSTTQKASQSNQRSSCPPLFLVYPFLVYRSCTVKSLTCLFAMVLFPYLPSPENKSRMKFSN